MSLELQSQAQAMTSLVGDMQKYMSTNLDVTEGFRSQFDAVKEIEESLKETLDNFQEFNSVLESFKKGLNSVKVNSPAVSENMLEKIQSFFTSMFDKSGEFNFVKREEKESKKTTEKITSEMKKAEKSQKDSAKAIKEAKGFTQSIKDHSKNMMNAAKEACEASDNLFQATGILKDKLVQKMKDGGSAIFSKIKSMAYKIPVVGQVLMGISIAATVIMGVTSIAWTFATGTISVFFNLTKTAMTLPFTIANSFIDLGNHLRTKLVEGLGNQIEGLKDEYSLDSYAGQSLKRLGELSKDAYLELSDNNSKLSRIYGYENVEAILSNAFENTKAIGIYAEYLGKSISGSIESATYVVESQRALGISSAELKYYALEGFSSVRGLQEVLAENMSALNAVAKKTGSNFKLLSREFHKLRLDIVQFGHLSAGELAEVSAEILRMKISAEDVASIFGKIDSFESAANMSAQLFQAFGMTIDAFDMVSANDPIEIIKQLKDGMLNTGKSFDTLNRHERSLLKQLTGLSDQALKTTFSYRGLSMTQEELRDNMEKTDPFEMMTDSMRSMGSAIRSIIRVMNFNSPFDALWRGLMEGASMNKEFTGGAINISKAYEALQRSMLKLDDSTISAITRPLNIILTRFKTMLTDGTIANLFKKGITTIGNFFTDVYAEVTDTNVDNQILDFEHMLSGLSRITTDNAKNLTKKYTQQFRDNVTGLMSAIPDKMKPLLKKHDLLDKSGNLKANASLEEMRNALVLSTTSNDKKFAESVQNYLKNKFDPVSLRREIEQLQVIEQGNQEIRKEILGNTGINRITNKLYEGLSTLLDEGGKLFGGIFKLGTSIMGGLIKGSVIGATTLVNLMNGKIEKVRDLLGEQVKDKNYLAKLLGFKDGELETLRKGLTEALSGLNTQLREKLPKLLKIMKEKILKSASDLKDTFKTVIVTALTEMAADPNISGIKGAAIQALVGDELSNIYKEQNKDSLISMIKYGAKNNPKYNRKFSDAELVEFANNTMFDTTFISRWDWGAKQSAMLYEIGQLNVNLHNMIVDSFNDRTSFHTFAARGITRIASGTGYALSKIGGAFIDSWSSGNDVIKLHDNDEVEVVASKQGGLLRKVYQDISDKYKQKVEDIKVITRTKKVLERSALDYDSDESIVLDLLSSVDNYIEVMSKKKSVVQVQQNNIKYIG